MPLAQLIERLERPHGWLFDAIDHHRMKCVSRKCAVL